MELFERAKNRREIAPQAIWFAIWACITGVAASVTPNPSGHGTHQALGLPPCPSVIFFDRPCPGCGLTTSWSALVHGNLGLAFSAHPLGPLLYLGFTATAVGGLVLWIRQTRFRSELPVANRALTASIMVFIAFGLVRMASTEGIATPRERWISTLGREGDPKLSR